MGGRRDAPASPSRGPTCERSVLVADRCTDCSRLQLRRPHVGPDVLEGHGQRSYHWPILHGLARHALSARRTHPWYFDGTDYRTSRRCRRRGPTLSALSLKRPYRQFDALSDLPAMSIENPDFVVKEFSALERNLGLLRLFDERAIDQLFNGACERDAVIRHEILLG